MSNQSQETLRIIFDLLDRIETSQIKQLDAIAYEALQREITVLATHSNRNQLSLFKEQILRRYQSILETTGMIKNKSIPPRIEQIEKMLDIGLNQEIDKSKSKVGSENIDPTALKTGRSKLNLLLELGIIKAIQDYQEDKLNYENDNQCAQILIDLDIFEQSYKGSLQSDLSKIRSNQYKINKKDLARNLASMGLSK